MTHPGSTGPRILLPTDAPRADEVATSPGRPEPEAPPSIEFFLEPVCDETRSKLRAWHDERARTMQISQPTIVTVEGKPYILVCANSPEFLTAQWAVGMAVQIRNASVARDAERELATGIQTAPAGLSMNPQGHRGRRR